MQVNAIDLSRGCLGMNLKYTLIDKHYYNFVQRNICFIVQNINWIFLKIHQI